jgi:hypothetical protein
MNRLNAFEWVLNTLWMLVSACECLWVIVNSIWAHIECAWMPMSEWEQPLIIHWVHMKAIEWVYTPIEWEWMSGVIIERSSPWCDHENNLICVRTEWLLNTCECTWMPLRESIEHPLNAIECMGTPIECVWTSLSEYWIPPEFYWVCGNTFEGVLYMPWMLLSAHESVWVSTWEVWMCTCRVVKLTVQMESKIGIHLRNFYVTGQQNRHRFLRPLPRYVWHLHTSLLSYRLLVKIHWRPLSSWKTIISKMYGFLPTLGLLLCGFDVSPNVSYASHDRAMRQPFSFAMNWWLWQLSDKK